MGSLGAEGRYFDFDKLAEVTTQVAINLNKIIDVNFYPAETARNSNMRHRPIGIGVQGLADAFILLGLPFDSPEAAKLNSEIFETIYYAALKASMETAKRDGPYSSYEGSPVSKGVLQFDMWGVTPSDTSTTGTSSGGTTPTTGSGGPCSLRPCRQRPPPPPQRSSAT